MKTRKNQRFSPSRKFSKKSQAWSLDIMFAVVLFIGTILIFYVILNAGQGDKSDELKREASTIIQVIVSEDPQYGIIDKNKIDVDKIQELLEKNYPELKDDLGLKNDFCIYLDDQQGNIIYINGIHSGVGSDKITVSNVPCGELSDELICQNAENNGVCDSLDSLYGDGYQQNCCDNFGKCC